MEREVEHEDFDFSKNKKVETILEKRVLLSEGMKKRAKYLAFLVLGGIAVGAGVGLVDTLSHSYLITKQKNAEIEVIQVKNEEIRKNELNQVEAKKQAVQNEIDQKEAQKKKAEDERITLQQEKQNYNVWIKNKDDIIANYEAQLSIYDKAYQDNVQAVKTGLISLDDLSSIREYYQAYKKDIHAWIKFINDATTSFDVYTNLDDDSKKSLDEELSKYQSGDLNRSNDLETMLLQQISNTNNDAEDDTQIAKLRTNARNKVIDDLADVIKNDNSTTKTKKLKR